MPRKNVILQNIYPYGLTARSNNKDWFQIPMAQVWSIFENEIAETAERYGVQTHCFVLMSNHFHWLVTTPNENLPTAMRYFMTETSRKIARASDRINKIYGARYKWSVISNGFYLANTVRYFYQNPVRAGICSNIDDYPWSTRSHVSKIVLHQNELIEAVLPADAHALTAWLNEIPDSVQTHLLRAGLRRAEFKLPRHPTKKMPTDFTIFD